MVEEGTKVSTFDSEENEVVQGVVKEHLGGGTYRIRVTSGRYVGTDEEWHESIMRNGTNP